MEENQELPPGLSYWERYHLTAGRLAKDYHANLLIKKKDVEESYGMSIKIVS
jgi:hypothetical protein